MTPSIVQRALLRRLEAQANDLIQRNGYLVVASPDDEPIGRVITEGFGPFRHPLVVIGVANQEDFEKQHGPCPPSPWLGPRYFFKVTAE